MSKIVKDFIQNKLHIFIINPKEGADLSNYHTNFDKYGTTIVTEKRAFFIFGKTNKYLLKMREPVVKFDRIKSRLRNYDYGDTIKAIAYKEVDSDFDSYEDAVLIKTKLRGEELDNELDYAYEHGCHCSYDCCAHWFGGVWPHKTKHVAGDYFIIYFHSSMNV